MGGVVGAIVGGVIGHFVPEDDAKGYERILQPGEILVSVLVESAEREREAMEALIEMGSKNIVTKKREMPGIGTRPDALNTLKSQDVHKVHLDNNDDNEFATGFKETAVESKFEAKDKCANAFSVECAESKLSAFEERFLTKIPQVGDLIERAGEKIQQFGKAVYAFGNRIEHYKRTSQA